MSLLTICLRKAGEVLSDAVRRAILDHSAQLRSEGDTATAAARGAVERALRDALDAERGASTALEALGKRPPPAPPAITELKQTLPSRVPFSKKVTPDITQITLPDLATLETNPVQFEKAVDSVMGDPGFAETGLRLRSTRARAEHVINRMVSNLLWLHDQMPAEWRQRARLWYEGAQAIAERWAGKWDKTRAQTAGMLAVLSPQKDWFMNTTMAERVGDILHKQMGAKWDPKMDAAAFKFLLGDEAKEAAAVEGEPDAAKQNTAAYEFANGKTLGEVVASGDKRAIGVWIRAYDEAHHGGAHAVITPEGRFAANKLTAAGAEARRAWGEFAAIGKAASIFMDGSPENISANLGGEHKVRNFYNNIWNASDPRFTTIDTHAVAAAQLRPLAGAAAAVTANFGKTGSDAATGVSGTYPLYYEAYKRAAAERGILPREMQSIVWEAVRGLFTEGFKTKANKEAVDAVWKAFSRGKIGLDEARQKIFELAGKIETPDWAREGEAQLREALRDTTYAAEREPHAGARVTFEMAPDPRDKKLTAAWGALPADAKAEVSRRIAWETAARAMATAFRTEAGKPVVLKGELHQQLGGWMDATNPSLSIWLDPKVSAGKALELANLLGYALNQEGMMFTSPKKFKGGFESGTVGIDLGRDATPELVHEVYTKLRDIKDENGEPLVFGHTTAYGRMVILHGDGLAAAEGLAKRVDETLGGRYNVGWDTLFAAFPEKGKDYDVAGQDQAGRLGAKSPLGKAADQLRQEAGRALQAIAGRRTEGSPLGTEHPARGAGAEPGREPGLAPPEEARTLYQSGPFYSALARGIASLPMKAGDAAAWSQALKGLESKGVKREEIAWTGLEEWLQLQSGKVTKEQVAKFLDEGGVRVEEVTLGGRADWRMRLDMLETRGRGNLTPGEREEMDALRAQRVLADAGELPQESPAKYQDYTLPGGENYREVLLTLPTRQEARDALAAFVAQMRAKYPGTIAERRAAMTPEDRGTLDRLSAAMQREDRPDYRSAHWEGHRNVLAHIRLNDRVDVDGRKVLMVEELQSDWQTEIRKQEKAIGKAVKPVPDAPFVGKTDAWLALAIKRVVKMAVDEGYDRVAFINGEQSAERYNLSKQIDRIEARPIGLEPGARRISAMRDGVLVFSQVAEAEAAAADMIGRELAAKVFASTAPVYLSGLDLKVGGEGMKAFYDKIVPAVAKDVVRKLGGEGLTTVAIERPGLGNVWHDGKIVANGVSREVYERDWGDAYTFKLKRGEPGESAGLTQPGFAVTDKMRERAAGGVPLFQAGGEDVPRGSIRFAEGPAIISLFERADPSTLIHETGHAWLEEILADANRPDAPGQIREDARKVMEFLGNDGGPITVEQHEKFARSAETYFMEGKAPRADLAGVFSRFKRWLMRIYRTVANLDAPINDEIRGVFDRLLATDEQIAEAQRSTGLTPNFKDRAEAGMTSAEWRAYNRAIEKANLEAESTLLDKMMARVRRERSAEYRAERAEVEASVAAEVDKRPDIAALNVMRSGKLPDGTEQRVRFSTDAIREQYGEAGVDSLPHGVVAKDGLHPDLIAETMGFESGDALVKALQGLEAQQREIRATEGEKRTVRRFLVETEADRRMDERRGELMDEAAIREEALAAVHGEARAELLAVELRYLRRMGAQALVEQGKARQEAGTEQPPGRGTIQSAVWNEQAKADTERAMREALTVTKPMLDAVRANVDAILQRRATGDIARYAQYLRDERKAAGEVQRAILQKDWLAAAQAKQRQIFSNILYSRSKRAADEIERGVSFLSKLQDGGGKSIDPEYRTQIEAMLERFDLRRGVSDKAIARRESLKAFLDRMEQEGIVPEIPQKLLDEAYRTHYRQMSYEDFSDLVDAVKQIEHLGKLKNRLLTSRAEREYAAARDALVAGVEEHAGDREANTRTAATGGERAAEFVRKFGWAHMKVATLARAMDGGRDGGPIWEYFVRTANERGDTETSMRAKATQELTEILRPILKGLTRRTFYPSIKRSLTREQVIAMALNTGNEGNWQRLLGGEGWTLEQVRPVLQTLTAAEWKAVQAVWDHFETYRPLIGAKEKRVYGREPKWVEAVPFEVTTADGEHMTLRGGYFPIVYDPRASVRAEQHADAESAKRQLQGAYTSATTRRGFTKTRVENVRDRPLLYSLKGVYSGVNDVIHDLAWHEWLIDTNKLLRSDKLDKAIRTTYGPDVIRQFKTWVEDVAEGDKGLQAELDGALGKLRHGVSIAGLGFNVMSALVQPLGITQSISRVGAQWIGRGVARYIAHPIEMTRQVNAESEFMMNRARTRFRELNELRNQVEGESGVRRLMGTYGYWLMMRAQQMVDVPTWSGAFDKALAEGHARERAVAFADQAVIDAQGSGMLKDLSAIERGGPAQKLFTVFYSFMNTALNLGVGTTMVARTPAQKAKLAAHYLLLYVVPAVLGVALKDAMTPGESGNWDDPDKLAKKLAQAQIEYLFGLMVVAREFASAATAAAGIEDHVRDYQGPAGVRLVTDVTALSKQAGQAWNGAEFDDAFRKALINTLGDMFGLPSAQVNRTITGAKALHEGKTENPAALLTGYQEPR